MLIIEFQSICPRPKTLHIYKELKKEIHRTTKIKDKRKVTDFCMSIIALNVNGLKSLYWVGVGNNYKSLQSPENIPKPQ